MFCTPVKTSYPYSETSMTSLYMHEVTPQENVEYKDKLLNKTEN